MVKFTFKQWRYFSEDFPIVFSTDHKNLHILQQDQAAFTQTNPMELILLILWLLHSVCTGCKELDSKCSFLQATIFSSSTYYTIVIVTVLQPSPFWMHHIFFGEVGRNSVIPGFSFLGLDGWSQGNPSSCWIVVPPLSGKKFCSFSMTTRDGLWGSVQNSV